MKINLPKIAFLIFLTLFCVLTSMAQQSGNSDKGVNAGRGNESKRDDNKECPETAIVRLKVTFHKSGKVTKAKVISSGGCKLFDEQALNAAKNIKFEPAVKDGKKITKEKTVEYTFTK
jgi:TonB family protein